jgi:uncharacterized membrane protein YeiB
MLKQVPSDPKQRIEVIDTLLGFALLGFLSMRKRIKSN